MRALGAFVGCALLVQSATAQEKLDLNKLSHKESEQRQRTPATKEALIHFVKENGFSALSNEGLTGWHYPETYPLAVLRSAYGVEIRGPGAKDCASQVISNIGGRMEIAFLEMDLRSEKGQEAQKIQIAKESDRIRNGICHDWASVMEGALVLLNDVNEARFGQVQSKIAAEDAEVKARQAQQVANVLAQNDAKYERQQSSAASPAPSSPTSEGTHTHAAPFESAEGHVAESQIDARFFALLRDRVIAHNRSVGHYMPLDALFRPVAGQGAAGAPPHPFGVAFLGTLNASGSFSPRCDAAIDRGPDISEAVWVVYNNVSPETERSKEQQIQSIMEFVEKSCSPHEYEIFRSFTRRVNDAIAAAIRETNQEAEVEKQKETANEKAAADELHRHVARLKSGEDKVQGINDARALYGAKADYSFVNQPLVSPDGTVLFLQGTVDRVDGKLIVCRLGKDYFAIRLSSETHNAAANSMRINGVIRVVGKYSENASYNPVLGQERTMIVLDGLWIE